MTRFRMTSVAFATVLALSACSSNDDDDTTDTTDQTDQTSMLAEDRELSSEPGGDTSFIAGYWNASSTGPESVPDSRLIQIEPNGLETGYELQQNDTDGSNCYSQAGPQTLTPGADDLYTRDDGTDFTATRSEDGGTLTVVVDEELTETWTLIDGRVASDLPLCPEEEETPLEDEASTLNPELDGAAPSSDPSGNDATAVAGLWDASGGVDGSGDQRYVAISTDGLWTDYDFRQDEMASDGNCYVVTPLRLDLETGTAEDGSFSLADGRSVDLTGTGDADALVVNFGAEAGAEESSSWPRVEGLATEDLEVCEIGDDV